MSSKLLRAASAGVGALAVSVAALFVLVDLPPVRARVLDRGRVYAEQQLGIFIDSDGLDFSVLARSIRLSNVRLAASRSERPFLEVDLATVFLDWRVIFGAPAVRRLELVGPRVTPRSSPRPDDESPASGEGTNADPVRVRHARHPRVRSCIRGRVRASLAHHRPNRSWPSRPHGMAISLERSVPVHSPSGLGNLTRRGSRTRSQARCPASSDSRAAG